MSQVEDHLKLVILKWCGAVPSEYSEDAQLRDIWNFKVANLDFDTDAISPLLSKIYSDPIFQDCPAAHTLTPGLFMTGGAIQTFSTLLVNLASCGNAPGLAQVMEPLAVKSKFPASKLERKTNKKKSSKKEG
jgi:hypothetical protein